MFGKKYTTEETIKGLMSGSPTVYKYLDAIFRKKVIQHVCSNSGSREDGEELYQDVIFEIYLNIEQGKFEVNKGKFDAYFMTIARRRWIDRLRKRNKDIDTIPIEEPIHGMSDTDPAEQAERELYNEQVHTMRKYIKQLNEDEQEFIRLYYYAEKSLAATAKQLGITYESAKQKIHRIRKRLRDMVAADTDLGVPPFSIN